MAMYGRPINTNRTLSVYIIYILLMFKSKLQIYNWTRCTTNQQTIVIFYYYFDQIIWIFSIADKSMCIVQTRQLLLHSSFFYCHNQLKRYWKTNFVSNASCCFWSLFPFFISFNCFLFKDMAHWHIRTKLFFFFSFSFINRIVCFFSLNQFTIL